MQSLRQSNSSAVLPVSSVQARDAEVVQTAIARLRERDFRFTRCVDCDYHDGVLILRGSVPTYYLKQLAQTAVARVPGVLQVDNRIDVFPGS